MASTISTLFHMHCFNYTSWSTLPFGSTTCSLTLHPMPLSTRTEVDHQKLLSIYLRHLSLFSQISARFPLSHFFLSLRNPHGLKNSWYKKNLPLISDFNPALWASCQFLLIVPEPGDQEQQTVQPQPTQLRHVFFPTPLLVTPNVQFGFDHCWAQS